MLNVFTLANGRLFQEEIESLDALAGLKPIWVDLDAPTPEEKGWISQHFGLTIPQDVVDDDLEESARFYEEDNGELHIRSDFLIDDEERSRNVRVAFILFKNVLFSVHGEDLPVFRLLRLRARRIPALIEDAKDVLLKLYDADAEYSADALEGVYDSLEAVSARVLKQDVNDQVAAEALAAIARSASIELFDAACLAVHAHAQAAERWAASRRAGAGLLAHELADELPAVLESLRGPGA